MIAKQTINSIKDRLVKVYRPLEIYLFGSYAWGKPSKDSDLDFLIVVSKSSKQSYERAVKGYHELREMTIPKDLLVLTKKEFEESAADVSSLCYKTKHEGKRIYEKP